MAASYAGLSRNVEILADGHAFLGMKDRLGRTAAHFACLGGKHDVIQLLCGKYGASATVTDANNKTLLDVCDVTESNANDDVGKRLCASAVRTAGEPHFFFYALVLLHR